MEKIKNYQKYLLERRKRAYKKFNVEYVENLKTGIEIKFTDLQIKTKEERGREDDWFFNRVFYRFN